MRKGTDFWLAVVATVTLALSAGWALAGGVDPYGRQQTSEVGIAAQAGRLALPQGVVPPDGGSADGSWQPATQVPPADAGLVGRTGITVLLVTHSLGLVERFCDEALWLDAGEVRGSGDPRRVVAAYITDVQKGEERELAAGDAKAQVAAAQAAGEAAAAPPDGAPADQPPPDMFKATEGRWGSREIEITSVELVGEDGQAGHIFQTGERVSIRLGVHSAQPAMDFVFGVGIFDADGTCCYGTNTNLEELQPDELDGDGLVTLTFDSLDLVDGSYKLDVAVHRQDGVPYDYHRSLYSFRMKSRVKDVGIYRPRHRWTFSDTIRFKAPRGA